MAAPVIMWFRQDLRLADNAALAAAAAAADVIPLYILDDETPGGWRIGGASRWWLHRSLERLARRVPLVLRRGPADKILRDMLRHTGAGAVYFTRDYAPWSGPLERRVRDIAAAGAATCHRYGGFLLHEPEAIRTGAGEPYRVYTPFARACLAAGEPRPPRTVPALRFWQGEVASQTLDSLGLLPRVPNWAARFESEWQPGEEGARARLAAFLDTGLRDYATGRDEPARPVTSRLSPHLHFGEISPAALWHAIRDRAARAGGSLDGAAEKFLRELLWREFSCHLLHHWPSLPDEPFRRDYAAFPWRDDEWGLRVWQRGETGYPIVDAGMRELWRTGTMHNRVRMIAASFLVKHLLIPWQAGERWFWDTLVDADIASNAANWQWVAGSGADAAPYFRIFNPVLQGEKFDAGGAYVGTWVPELARLPAKWIHRPWEAPAKVLAAAGIELGRDYPHPVIDHGMARNRALAGFATIRRSGS